MTPTVLAATLRISDKSLRAWLRRAYPRSSSTVGRSWFLTQEQVAAAQKRWSARGAPTPPVETRRSKPVHRATSNAVRSKSDEAYVIDLCDEILGETAVRQHRFPWLCGDAGKNGKVVCLPVDAYYEGHKLVIEYRERQHDVPTPFFDRRHTVSGVGRGAQRKLYDQRRESEIPKHDLQLVVIKPLDLDADARGRLNRNGDLDVEVIRRLLARTLRGIPR